MATRAWVACQISINVNILITHHDMKAVRFVFMSIKYFYLFVMQVVTFALGAEKFCAIGFVILIELRDHDFPFLCDRVATS